MAFCTNATTACGVCFARYCATCYAGGCPHCSRFAPSPPPPLELFAEELKALNAAAEAHGVPAAVRMVGFATAALRTAILSGTVPGREEWLAKCEAVWEMTHDELQLKADIVEAQGVRR